MRDGWSVKTLAQADRHQRHLSTIFAGHTADARNRSDQQAARRSPRVRLDAELVRDVALTPAACSPTKSAGRAFFRRSRRASARGSTTAALSWTVSQGEDRYRRGLYTFMKRTAPYAMFSAFDAPSGEACVARREYRTHRCNRLPCSTTRCLSKPRKHSATRLAAEQSPVIDRMVELFRRCVSRPPNHAELDLLVAFYTTHRERLAKGELDAKAIAGPATAMPSNGLPGHSRHGLS